MLFQGVSRALLSTLLLIVDEFSNAMPTSEIGARNNIDNYIPATARTMERSLSILDSRATTTPSSSTKASKILYAHHITFSQTIAINDAPNASSGLITAYTALITPAHHNWTADPAPKSFSITTGSINVALVSDTGVAWECVSAIGQKLIALAKAQLIGFFGAVFYCPSNDVQSGFVAVGVGISVVAITNALLLAKRPSFRGSAPILPTAGVLAANMLRSYGLAAPAA